MRRVIVSFDVFCGDYGGKANLEFYLSAHAGWTVILVFMHGGSVKDASEVAEILHSFSRQ